MTHHLNAMSVTMPDIVGHPNRLPFHGVLTLVGVASQRSPSGARGHRVMLTRAATEAALPSLLGMALDYVPSLDAHDARRKIGIITEANITSIPHRRTSGLPPVSPSVGDRVGPNSPTGPGVPPLSPAVGDRVGPNSPAPSGAPPLSPAVGDRVGLNSPAPSGAPPLSPAVGDRVGPHSPTGQIVISGYLFAHDFPDVVDKIRAHGSSTLGMSYEIANATVPNQDALIWTVTDFTFTGAAVLLRDKAAYPQTWIAVQPASSRQP